MADGLGKSATLLLGNSGLGIVEGQESTIGSRLDKRASSSIMGKPEPEDISSIAFGMYANPSALFF